MRRTIRIDEHGHVRMEGNPQEEVWMTLAEIADLFNLPAATVGREIKGIRKTGVLVDYEACKYIRMADGTPRRTPPKMENAQDFLQFDKNGDVLDNFFRNFFRQCKEPSRFGFYRIAADQAENLLGVMKELLKDPVANAELLAPHKVDTSAYEKQVAQEQKARKIRSRNRIRQTL